MPLQGVSRKVDDVFPFLIPGLRLNPFRLSVVHPELSNSISTLGLCVGLPSGKNMQSGQRSFDPCTLGLMTVGQWLLRGMQCGMILLPVHLEVRIVTQFTESEIGITKSRLARLTLCPPLSAGRHPTYPLAQLVLGDRLPAGSYPYLQPDQIRHSSKHEEKKIP
jgi:hypothetical protein